MDAGWKLNDIEEADYFLLLHLFSEVDEENKEVDAEDFFRSILDPKNLALLDESKKQNTEECSQ